MSVKPSSSATRQLSRIKVISMGEERVGKSCLIKRFCEEKFVDKYVPTIGIDFGVKPVSVEQSGTVRINFWDMAGGSEYYAVRSEFYPDAQGAMLVFDVCNKASFDKLGTWMKEARVHGAPSSMCYVVCGNKTDASRRRTIPEAEGRRFASEIGAPYYETSAKDGSGVVPMFEDLFKRVCVARASALSGD
mmetsp:Transcript_22979/g.70349  ORF Transcript_22979/g.70349 Transcript_22979/m.70349 type:complete len:190 (+) Transcript_22979:58-627(+)